MAEKTEQVAEPAEQTSVEAAPKDTFVDPKEATDLTIKDGYSTDFEVIRIWADSDSLFLPKMHD